jgi:hypothetical protein
MVTAGLLPSRQPYTMMGEAIGSIYLPFPRKACADQFSVSRETRVAST